MAVNRATDHPNLVHNDEYARSHGFRGGLVPGVDVYAYMTRAAVEHLGREWIERGEGEVRFLRPVYDGDALDIDATGDESDALTITASCAGEVRALLTARRGPRPESDQNHIREAPIFEPKLKAVRKSFPEGLVLGSLAVKLTESDCVTQLAEVGEELDFYRLERLVHPGHLLRFADQALSANVDLPPWMHVGSFVHHHALVHWDESISVRARVMGTFVRKRNQFVQLEVEMSTGDGRPVMRVSPYTAIYKPSFVRA